MNILMLGWELPPHNSGGLGVACYHMSKALAKQGANIDFVVPYRAEHPNIDFMKIHCATNLSPFDRYGLGAYDSSEFTGNYLSEKDLKNNNFGIRDVQKRYVRYVENIVTTLNPDVVHVHDWLTMEAGIRAKEITGVPLIVHVHATEYDRSGNNYGNRLVHEIEYQGLIAADRIIAVSQLTKDIIVEKYCIPPEKIEVIHNAIDIERFNNEYVYDQRTYRYLENLKNEGYTVVASITRFTIQKGLVFFLHAAARALEKYNKLVFLLAGDGDQRDELIKLTADLGISDKVFFTGFVRGKQWRDAYSIADVFVMSSISEPFGLTALEAAYHDNAIILTKQSGVGEILDSVFRYDFWDEDKLADQIIGIATSKVLKNELKNNIKNEYARISWEDVAKSCMRLYDKSLKIGAAV